MSERVRIQRKREKATAFPSVQSETFQGDPTGPEHTMNEVPSIVQEVLFSSGQPLDASIREFMEPRFGHDFSQVRVHTDEQAVESAQAVNALAYTVGRDVVFGEGQYEPGTSEGRGLLAHELTHTIQQQQSGPQLQRATKTDTEVPVATVKMYEYTFEGQKVTLTEEQYQHEIARMNHNLEVEFKRVESTAAWMKEEHEKFISETHAHWYSVGVVSDIVGGTEPPHVGIWSWPNAAIANGREALRTGRVENAARQLQLANKFFKDAEHEWGAYMEKTIGGAQVTQRYLENTRDISFSIAIGTAAVVAAPVVAGAVAATGAGTGVTAIGTGLAVTGGGALAGGSLRAGTSVAGQALAGDEVSGSAVWKEFKTGAKRGAVDAATGVIGVGAGKALGTAGSLGGRVVKGAFAGTASGAGGGALEATLEGKSAEEIAEATGKGAFTGLIGGGVGGGSGHLLGEASTGARFATGAISGGTASAAGTALAGGSKGDIEAAFLTGSLTGGVSSAGEHRIAALEHQAPPAQQSVPEVESATPSPELKVEKPVASESTVAAHVTEESQTSDIALKKPEVSTVEESDAMWRDLGTEMQNEPEGKGLVVGQKLGKRTPEDELTKPGKSKTASAKEAELLEQLKKARIEQGLEKLNDVPDLKKFVEESNAVLPDGKTALSDFAAENPEGLRDLWKQWNAGEKKLTFDKYVNKRQSEFRGGAGELAEAFGRGPEEIMVKALKPVTEPGIDMITYDPKGKRVKLIDNKAYKKGPTEVTALEENLPHNLDEAISDVQDYAQQAGVPPEVDAEVLPHLRAAKADIDAHIQANPNKALDSLNMQKAFDAILDKHGIDRVVTTSGGKPGIKISKGLETDKGFKQE